MSKDYAYLMEGKDEAVRLDVKTDPEEVRRQARWCGIKPGMRVLDLGCGSGKTASILFEAAQPGGALVGVDYSRDRIAYARKKYGRKEGMSFVVHDLTKPLPDMEAFDLIWVRFVLEYYRKEGLSILRNLKNVLKPGGYLCLLDLDYNCLSHYELPAPMAELLPKLMTRLDETYNFDTFAGRKLYSYLYDLKYENIEIELMAHHLIYGKAKDADAYNWLKKIETAAPHLQDLFETYPGGYKAFSATFERFFLDPRRFTYTPLILCKGMRPSD